MENTNDKQFNDLEKAVLEWYVATYQDENLTAQIRSAKLKKRDWTGHGFYVYLETSHDLKPIDFSILPEVGVKPPVHFFDDPKLKNRKRGFPIGGPDIEPSEDIEDGGGSLLWGEDGYIDCIEMYAFGHLFKEHVTNFKIGDPLEKIAPTSPSFITSPMEKLKRVIGFFKK